MAYKADSDSEHTYGLTPSDFVPLGGAALASLVHVVKISYMSPWRVLVLQSRVESRGLFRLSCQLSEIHRCDSVFVHVDIVPAILSKRVLCTCTLVAPIAMITSRELFRLWPCRCLTCISRPMLWQAVQPAMHTLQRQGLETHQSLMYQQALTTLL